jgi:ribose 5-phosphate isomerase B
LPPPLLIASDHAGFELKQKLKASLERRGIAHQDLGTHSSEPTDYPDFAHRLAAAVSRGEAERGVLVCGTGQGMVMVANRYPNVRAALPYDEPTARLARQHNDANVIAFGGRTLDHALAERLLDVFLDTPFQGGRHAERVRKIDVGDAGGSASARSILESRSRE